METDKTTLADLAIFNQEEEFSIFHKLNLCLTTNGKDRLRFNFSNPLKSIAEIEAVQQTLQFIIKNPQYWPKQISNGTIMVMERFYDTAIDPIPSNGSSLSAFIYKLLHGPDFSLVKYSITHCFDFIKGMQLMVNNFLKKDTPELLKKTIDKIQHIINKRELGIVEKYDKAANLTIGQQLQLAHFIRYRYKESIFDLLAIYTQLDAWYGMAQAVKTYQLVFPTFMHSDEPVLSAKGLYQLLIPKPVSHNVELTPHSNFIFLTGANMAGKSTFIKSVGAAVYLAHIGMGVPAQHMQLSYFDGLLSNINVVDNIVKGESYFYNEVQRVKTTITKVSNHKKWLVLIDELFKGTNIQDAMKCSTAVIEGLLKIKNSLFIVSSHLYEIADNLKKYPNINFKYFETSINNEHLHFSYHLKDGISNDRLGYLILKREGVVDMLEKL